MDDGGCDDRSNCAASDGMLLGEDTKWDMVVGNDEETRCKFHALHTAPARQRVSFSPNAVIMPRSIGCTGCELVDRGYPFAYVGSLFGNHSGPKA